VLAGSVALSRVLGFARDAWLSRVIGAARSDAYRAAFLLPDLLNYFLAGGALSIASSRSTRAVETAKADAAADRFLAVIFGTTGALAVAATVVLWLARFRSWSCSSRASPTSRPRSPRISPGSCCPRRSSSSRAAWLRGALMARGHFASQSLAPLVYNLDHRVRPRARTRIGAEGFAWGALLGAIAGAFGTAWLEMRHVPEIRLRGAHRPARPALRGYLASVLPLVAGVTLGTADDWLALVRRAARRGAIASLGYARQLMLLPSGSSANRSRPRRCRRSRATRRWRDASWTKTLLGALRAGLSLACLRRRLCTCSPRRS